MSGIQNKIFELFLHANKIELAPIFGDRWYTFVEEKVFANMGRNLKNQEKAFAEVAGVRIEGDIAYFTKDHLCKSSAYAAFIDGYNGRSPRYVGQQDDLTKKLEEKIGISNLSIQFFIILENYDLAVGMDPRADRLSDEIKELLMGSYKVCAIFSYIIEYAIGKRCQGQDHLLEKTKRQTQIRQDEGPRIIKFPGT